MNKIVILSLGFLLQVSVFAQKKSDLKNADGFFKEGDYYNAIVNYEVYLGIRKPLTTFSPYTLKRKNNTATSDSGLAAIGTISSSSLITQQIAWQLGESYRQLYHYQRAEACYARLLSLGSDANYPLAHYWYGVCLRSNNKFDEAEKQIKLFLKENTKDKANTSLGNKELATLTFIKEQMQKADKLLAFNKLKGNVGQTEGAYAPIVFNDTLLFTSARIVDTVSKFSSVNMHVNHLFYNTLTNNNTVSGTSTIIHFPSKLSLNEGTAALTPDKKKLYFSRNSGDKNKSISAIYVSNRLSDGSWSEPEKLDSKINTDGHNSIQPSVTQDNKYMLFASDRDGGIGGFDIWASSIDASGNLSEPFNLKSINTKEDEEAPFYHSNSQSLVFASKGYLGMGGFDLYAAKGDILHLQTPVNLGYPTNSPKDDIYFFSTSVDSLLKASFVSSDRASDCCLELFAVNKTYPVKHYQSIKGIVNDCNGNSSLDAVSIVVANSTANYSIITTQNGSFNIAVADSVTGFNVSKDGYNAKYVPFAAATKIVNDTVYKVSICLEKIPPVIKAVDSVNISDKPLIVYFDFNKSDIKKQYDTVLDKVVALLNQYPTIQLNLQINGYTDDKGTDEYNIKLGQKRAESCKQYIVAKGIDENRLTLNSFGKATPAVSNTTPDNKDNPAGRALNRRVELTIRASNK